MWRLNIIITHTSLPHTHPCTVLRVHNPHEADGDRVCALRSYSRRVDCFCSSAWELWWQSPHCPLALLKGSCGWGGACSTWAASYLCLWLCFTASLGTVAIPSLILHVQNLYATKKRKRAPVPPILTSIFPVTACRELISSLTISSQWIFLCVKHSRGQHCTMNNI